MLVCSYEFNEKHITNSIKLVVRVHFNLKLKSDQNGCNCLYYNKYSTIESKEHDAIIKKEITE